MKTAVSHLEAICFAIAGFTLWVMGDGAIKLAGQSMLPSYELVAFLGLVIAGFLTLVALGRGQLRELWPVRPGRQLVRSSLDLGNNLCVVVALRHLPLTLFYILVFTAPMVVALLAAVFLKEQLSWKKAAAIVLGFLGVVVAVNPFGLGQNGGQGGSQSGDWIGYAACAVCVACFAVAMVWSRVLSQTERAESMTFFSGLVMAVAGFGAMLFHAVALNGRLVLVVLAMGLLGALGNLCYFVALKHTTAANVSQYHYTQLLSGALVAYFVFAERPTRFMLLGAVLIVASGLSIALRASAQTASAPG